MFSKNLVQVVFAVLLLVFVGGCAARSAKAVIPGNMLSFKGDQTVNLTIYVRPMDARRFAEIAKINPGWLKGSQNSFTYVRCNDLSGNIIFTFFPSLEIVDGHIEYQKDSYNLDFYLGETDGKKFDPVIAPKRIGLSFFLDDKHKHFDLGMDTVAVDTWYIVSISTSDSFRGIPNVRPMECFSKHMDKSLFCSIRRQR